MLGKLGTREMNLYFHGSRTDIPVLVLYNLDLQWTPQEITEAEEVTQVLIEAVRKEAHPVQGIALDHCDLAAVLKEYDPRKYIVFNWCEEIPGIPHSSALAARILEALGFTFTGADSYALALSQDKRLVKQALNSRKIPTPKWRIYPSFQKDDWNRFPAIVKPAFEHSSVGITRQAIVQTPVELDSRVHFVIDELQQPALVETFIDGREIHVGVVGNHALRMLPPAEIDFSCFEDIHDRLCTYEANFEKDSDVYNNTIPLIPATLSQSELDLLESTVFAAYRASSCRDYARMDLRLQDGVFYILDVNPNADICPENSLVRAADLAGLSYGNFASLLINLAAHRHPVFGKLFRLTENREVDG
jgi:D-alanine-D-alanine ligase